MKTCMYQSLKPRRPKSREVSSRFLSPTSNNTTTTTTTTTTSFEAGIPFPNQSLSPNRHKTKKHHRSHEDSGFMRASSSSSSKLNKNLNPGNQGDHLGNERLKDRKSDEKPAKGDTIFLDRQRSCSEFIRSENEKESAKENHRPSIGKSMRNTAKFSSSSKASCIVPGRLSIDENDIYRRSMGQKSDSFTNAYEFDSDCFTDFGSTAIAEGTNSISSRKSSLEGSSKYMKDFVKRTRRGNSDSSMPSQTSWDGSPALSSKKFTIKNAIKRVNSLTSAQSQWALSPGRTGSPPMSVENKGKLPMSFSSLKPPNSPNSRGTGVEKLFNMGLDLFKTKKSLSNSMPVVVLGNSETAHQLRMLHNRWMQWRYANARAEAVNWSTANRAERNLLYAWESLTKLRHSVVQKKLQLQKEKLDMKLNFVLYSQIKLLEAWGDMERQQLSAVSRTKECLHSVVCRVPLIDGAKVDTQLATFTLGNALDFTASIKSMLTCLAPSVEKTVVLLSKLAKVVAQEKLVLEHCLELLRTISTLEFGERRLRCSIIQLKLWQQQQKKQQQEIPFVYGQNIAFEDKITGYPHIHSKYMTDNEIGMVDKDLLI
nr:QWRF motif-containing protein 3 [Quercus suber]